MLDAPSTAPIIGHTPTRPKVLVIDDELGPRESMSYLLQDEFEVLAVDRVDRGLALAKAESFAVVIMDIRMPQKNGIQGLEEFRRIDADAAVIMMTGYGALASAQAAISLGANEYLKKPFDVDVLLAAVRRHAAEAQERQKRTALLKHLGNMYESVKREQKKHQMQVGYGQAAAEMVHDICNPLVVTIGYTNMLLDEVRRLGADTPALRRIIHYTERLESCSSFCLHLAESWRQSTRHQGQGDGHGEDRGVGEKGFGCFHKEGTGNPYVPRAAAVSRKSAVFPASILCSSQAAGFAEIPPVIHPTAIVSPLAKIGYNVRIGPFCVFARRTGG